MNTTNAPSPPDRDTVLARLRERQGRAGDTARVQAHLATHPRGPGPAHADGDLLDRFTRAALALSSSIARIADPAAVPAAVAAYLSEHRLPRRAVCWPALADLAWQDAGLDVEARPATGDDLVGVTGAFAGVAETGSMLMLSGATTAAATSLLPETHIAVLPVARIVASLEDAWDRVRQEQGQLPRAANLVSGPSRTGDIEQTITLGAHGPYRVHILLVG